MKKFLLGLVLAAMLVVPFAGQAATLAELQAQLAQLLAQLAAMQGTGTVTVPSSNPTGNSMGEGVINQFSNLSMSVQNNFYNLSTSVLNSETNKADSIKNSTYQIFSSIVNSYVERSANLTEAQKVPLRKHAESSLRSEQERSTTSLRQSQERAYRSLSQERESTYTSFLQQEERAYQTLVSGNLSASDLSYYQAKLNQIFTTGDSALTSQHQKINNALSSKFQGVITDLEMKATELINTKINGNSGFVPCPVITKTLQLGSTGAEVVALQKYLIEEGLLALDGATGYFGPMTKAAVIAWQRANGISIESGVWGPLSRAALDAMCRNIPQPDNISINSPADLGGFGGVDYNKIFSVANRVSGRHYSWSIAKGTLPPGLTLRPTTVQCFVAPCPSFDYQVAIAGKPSTYGSYPLVLAVNDNLGNSGSVTLSIFIGSISQQPSITITSPNGGEVWREGDSRSVNLSYNNMSSGNAQILLGDTGLRKCLIASVPLNGNINITIPRIGSSQCPNLPAPTSGTGSYKLYVIAQANGGIIVSDESDNFFTVTSSNNQGDLSLVQNPNMALPSLALGYNSNNPNSPYLIGTYHVRVANNTNNPIYVQNFQAIAQSTDGRGGTGSMTTKAYPDNVIASDTSTAFSVMPGQVRNFRVVATWNTAVMLKGTYYGILTGFSYGNSPAYVQTGFVNSSLKTNSLYIVGETGPWISSVEHVVDTENLYRITGERLNGGIVYFNNNKVSSYNYPGSDFGKKVNFFVPAGTPAGSYPVYVITVGSGVKSNIIYVMVGGNSEPFVNIVSPNGNEIITQGQQTLISWKGTNIAKVTAQLVPANFPDGGFNIIGFIGAVSSKDYSYLWWDGKTVYTSLENGKPITISPGSYKIRLVANAIVAPGGKDFLPQDVSAAPFTIIGEKMPRLSKAELVTNNPGWVKLTGERLSQVKTITIGTKSITVVSNPQDNTLSFNYGTLAAGSYPIFVDAVTGRSNTVYVSIDSGNTGPIPAIMTIEGLSGQRIMEGSEIWITGSNLDKATNLQITGVDVPNYATMALSPTGYSRPNTNQIKITLPQNIKFGQYNLNLQSPNGESNSKSFTVYSNSVIVCKAGQIVGDINGDGRINLDDSRLIDQLVVGNIARPVDLCCVDVTGDGKLDATDSVKVKNMAAGLSSEAPTYCRVPVAPASTVINCANTPNSERNYSVRTSVTGVTACTDQSKCMTPSTSYDACANTTTLNKYYCANGFRYVDIHACPNGCTNGTCALAPVTSQAQLNQLAGAIEALRQMVEAFR